MKGFNEKGLPLEPSWKWAFQDEGESEWVRAWRGSKLEAVCSIMPDGTLRPSRSAEMGERFSGQGPGATATRPRRRRITTYMRCVDAFQDGALWATKWEVWVDRPSRVPVKTRHRTDQWVQHPGSIRLVALWVQGVRRPPPEAEVQLRWGPWHDASPLAPKHPKEETEQMTVCPLKYV